MFFDRKLKKWMKLFNTNITKAFDQLVIHFWYFCTANFQLSFQYYTSISQPSTSMLKVTRLFIFYTNDADLLLSFWSPGTSILFVCRSFVRVGWPPPIHVSTVQMIYRIVFSFLFFSFFYCILYQGFTATNKELDSQPRVFTLNTIYYCT